MMDQIACYALWKQVFAFFLSCLTMAETLSLGLGDCVCALDSCMENTQRW